MIYKYIKGGIAGTVSGGGGGGGGGGGYSHSQFENRHRNGGDVNDGR